jgi:hypothetical protein
VTKGIPNKFWLTSLLLALASNITATTLTLLYDNGTTYVETNTIMVREIALLGQWVPVFNAALITAIYCGLWYFIMRGESHPDVKAFMSLVLFFFPALTSLDALSDVSLVFGGVPLVSAQDIQISGVLFGVIFLLNQLRTKPKRGLGDLSKRPRQPDVS